jgi:hypothetical protein
VIRLSNIFSSWWRARKLLRHSTADANSIPVGSTFSLTVEYLEPYRIVKIVTSGELTLEANNQLVAAAIAASRQYHTNCILIDDRNVEIRMNFINIYDLPEHNQQLGVDNRLRVALLYTPSEETDKVFQFYENRSYNKDFQHRVFTEEHKALSWLTISE